jgi:hypothetical protein
MMERTFFSPGVSMYLSRVVVAALAGLLSTNCISKGDTNIDPTDEVREGGDDDASSPSAEPETGPDDDTPADDDVASDDDAEPEPSDDDTQPEPAAEPEPTPEPEPAPEPTSDDDVPADDDTPADDDVEPEPPGPTCSDVDNGGCDPLTECNDGPSGPECSPCPDGHSGTGLTECVPVCDPDPCRNDGTCMEDGDDFLCECPDGYDGKRCETVAFVELAAGGSNTCGRRADGSVECWGGPPLDTAEVPEGVYTQISVGQGHACGVRDDLSVACWGENGAGEGVSPEGEYQAVSVYGTSCALKLDGSIFCWGGPTSDTWKPVPEAVGFKQLDGDIEAGCAIAEDDTLECWGYESNGLTTAPTGLFRQVSVGNDALACALTFDDTVTCWGIQSTPAVSDAPSDMETFVEVHSGWSHACALETDGMPTCWGMGGDGQLFSSPPVALEIMACGSGHCCGKRTTTGQVECWGSNMYGEGSPP